MAIAFKYMYMAHLEAGIDKAIEELCIPNHSSTSTSAKTYFGRYTFVSSVDNSNPGPCVIVAFFHLLLDSPTPLPRRFLTYLLGTGLPCILVPLIEAYRYRGKQHWLLSYPTFWLLLTQAVTIGMTFPIYWPLLIMTRRSSRAQTGELNGKKDPRSKALQPQLQEENIAFLIEPEEALALALGLIVGAILPSTAMVLANHPFATWVWQFYPAYIAIVRAVCLHYMPPKSKKKGAVDPGQDRGVEYSHRILRTTYIGCFLFSTIVHVHSVWPHILRGDFDILAELVIPSVDASASMHPSLQAHNFLKWDYILGYASLVLGIGSSAKGLREIVTMLIWYMFAIPLCGMGGAVMGVLAWRDVL